MGRGGSGGKKKKRVFISAFLLPNARGGQEPDRVRHSRLVYVYTHTLPLSHVFVSCHVFRSSRHVFPFCIRYFYVPVSCWSRLSCVSVFAFVSLFRDWFFVMCFRFCVRLSVL